MYIIQTNDLYKRYGRSLAVDHISLSITADCIFGISGKTKSGKSALLRILATLSQPTSGDVVIAGYSLTTSPERIRRVVGYMPQTYSVYKNTSVSEYMQFFAESHGIPSADQTTLVDDLLRLVDLFQRKTKSVATLTQGMLQRLNLARTLIHDPQILLLDEPFSWIDPRAQVEMRELLKELKRMGKTMIVTSALPANLNALCDELAIMEDGRIERRYTSDNESIAEQLNRVLIVRFFGSQVTASDILTHSTGVRRIEVISSGTEVPASSGTSDELPAIVTVLKEIRVDFCGGFNDASVMLRALMRHGVQVVSFGESFDESASVILDRMLPSQSV